MFDTVWQEEHPGTFELLDTQIDRQQFEALQNRYYELCGWNPENGRPTKQTLERLDMADVAQILEEENLLG